MSTLSEVSGAIAGGLGGALGYSSARETNRMSEREAGRNREFQAYMSNNAVYRRMQDLRRSGINPILAGRYDASTPAGAMAQFQSPGAGAMQGISTAVDAVHKTQDMDRIEAQVEDLVKSAGLKHTQDWLTEFDIILRQWDIATQQTALEMLRSQLEVAQLDGNIAESTFGVIMRHLDKLTGALSPWKGSVRGK